MTDKMIRSLLKKEHRTPTERARLLRHMDAMVCHVIAIAGELAEECETIAAAEGKRAALLDSAADKLKAFGDFLNEAPLPSSGEVR
jgi:hypothetical protein